jgi:hypothetical protein
MKRNVRIGTRHISGEDEIDDLITDETNISCNNLSVGNARISPGNEVVNKFQIQTNYLDTTNLANGFGNSIQFGFNRGFSGDANQLDATEKGSISCFFKSGAKTGAPYVGMRFEGQDDNTQRTLMEVYHQSPNDDGRSVLEVGQAGDGVVLARNYLRTEIINNDIGGYFFGIISAQGATNVNASSGASVSAEWTTIYMDTDNFSRPTSEEVRIKNTGVYEISFNVFLNSSSDRVNPWVRVAIDGNDTGYGGLSYIRNANNHNENCWVMSPILYTINANEDLTIEAGYEALGNTGATFYFFSSSPIIHSHLMIKRIV